MNSVQGFVSKLSVNTAVATTRRLSSGSLPGLPATVCARLTTTATPAARPARRHSIAAFESTARFKAWSTRTFPREITWLAGAPGAGKGTNSTFIASARGYDAPTIVVSSLLETPECKRIKDAGGMVDDEFVFSALVKELAKPEYRHGVVVDGFPRTEKQAQMISELHDSMASTSFNFVTLFVEEQVSIQRQLSRGDAIRKINTMRMYGGLAPLEERATDVCEEAARTRYSNFKQQYEAINKLSSRFPLAVVDAAAPIETVRQRLASACSTGTLGALRRTSFTSTIQEEAGQRAYM